MGDLEKLAALTRGLAPGDSVGSPIDPTENGPLGPYWVGEKPGWYRTPELDEASATAANRSLSDQRMAKSPLAPLMATRFEHATKAIIKLAHALNKSGTVGTVQAQASLSGAAEQSTVSS